MRTLPAGRRTGLASLCGAMFLTACATVSVSTDYDRAVDFSRYHTFRIAGGHLVHEGVSDDANTLVKDRIATALRGALQAKGLQENPGQADLEVGYFGGARSRTEVERMPAYGPGPGFGPFWTGGWWDPTYNDWWARTYNEGTLIIDLVDTQTKRLIWRAYAQTEVQVPISDQKIADAVNKAFQNFPPRK